MLYALLDSLRTGLEAHFAETVYEQAPSRKGRQPTPGGSEEGASWRSPSVYVGDLPPKRSQPEAPEDYPYILVRIPNGRTGDDEDGALAHAPNVSIICGVWTDEGEEAQHSQVMQITYRVMQWLLENRLVDGRYERSLPFQWGFGHSGDVYSAGAQPTKYSLGWITLTFNLRAETPDASIL